jgi:hypothetical protein
MFPTGQNEPDPVMAVKPSPVYKPTAHQTESEIARIVAALESAGDMGVSVALMRELSPSGYRQRISDIRAEWNKKGLDVVCERNSAGSIYYKRPFSLK